MDVVSVGIRGGAKEAPRDERSWSSRSRPDRYEKERRKDTRSGLARG